MSNIVLRDYCRHVLVATQILTIAIVGSGLAACTDEELNSGIFALEGNNGTVVPLAAVSSSSSVQPGYTVLPTEPMGETIATGPDCRPVFRLVICQ